MVTVSGDIVILDREYSVDNRLSMHNHGASSTPEPMTHVSTCVIAHLNLLNAMNRRNFFAPFLCPWHVYTYNELLVRHRPSLQALLFSLLTSSPIYLHGFCWRRFVTSRHPTRWGSCMVIPTNPRTTSPDTTSQWTHALHSESQQHSQQHCGWFRHARHRLMFEEFAGKGSFPLKVHSPDSRFERSC